MSDWPVSLVTHVSSNHRCWYFHQPRPPRASPAWTLGAQHSLGAKNKELFLAHFHVLHKSAQTKMRKDNAQLSHIFPTWRVPGPPGSHTDTARVRVSSQFPVLAAQAAAQHQEGKLIPASGPVLIYFLDMFLLAWRLLAPRSHPHTSHHLGSWHTRPPHHWDGNEGFLSTFSPAACTRIVGDAKGMHESCLILKGGESFREWQCIVHHEQELAVQPWGRGGAQWLARADMRYLAVINSSVIIGSPETFKRISTLTQFKNCTNLLIKNG